MATDHPSETGYNIDMVKKPVYRNPPATPMNKWVRDALESSGLSQQALSDLLSRTPTVGTYDRSMVQKMTVARKVSMDEARAISQITGHPLPDTENSGEVVAEYQRLSPDSQAAIRILMKELLRKQQGDESD